MSLPSVILLTCPCTRKCARKFSQRGRALPLRRRLSRVDRSLQRRRTSHAVNGNLNSSSSSSSSSLVLKLKQHWFTILPRNRTVNSSLLRLPALSRERDSPGMGFEWFSAFLGKISLRGAERESEKLRATAASTGRISLADAGEPRARGWIEFLEVQRWDRWSHVQSVGTPELLPASACIPAHYFRPCCGEYSSRTTKSGR